MEKKGMLEINDKAYRLCHGEVVDIEGFFVKLTECQPGVNPCLICRVKDRCYAKMMIICSECERINKKSYKMDFAKPSNY